MSKSKEYKAIMNYIHNELELSYVQPNFLSMYYGGDNHTGPIDKSAPTIKTKDCCSLVSSYNFKDAGKDINLPSLTLLTKNRLSLILPFFMNQYSGGG